MSFSESVLKNDEKAIFQLRDLYSQYGYSLYKVSKFEEYDLYARNKSFLVSQNILSFTDTNGKLMALKPDVTLSIIKNVPDGETGTHKFCYNETVYRTATDSDGFREIMQTGLECIGMIDLYAECEVLMLAMRSLQTISNTYILDLSHMGILEGLLEEAGIAGEDKTDFIRLIESKNTHSLMALCQNKKIVDDMKERLRAITELYLPIQQALPLLKQIVVGKKMTESYEDLQKICDLMNEYGFTDRLYLDFSIVNDVSYYDGICFKGFVHEIPESVLSGGRYDRLLHRLHKQSGAIGFAVYLDRLERLEDASESKNYDIDVVLQYDQQTPAKDILTLQSKLISEGNRVITLSQIDPALRYRRLIKITDGGAKTIETND